MVKNELLKQKAGARKLTWEEPIWGEVVNVQTWKDLEPLGGQCGTLASDIWWEGRHLHCLVVGDNRHSPPAAPPHPTVLAQGAKAVPFTEGLEHERGEEQNVLSERSSRRQGSVPLNFPCRPSKSRFPNPTGPPLSQL